MADVTVEQAGTAAVWFTTQAGITATVLAVVCICLGAALVWSMRHCREELRKMAEVHNKELAELSLTWGKRIDQFRTDVKEAFGQNSTLADKMVEAMHSLNIEIARMSARRERE